MIIPTSQNLVLFSFSHLSSCGYFSLPIGTLFLGKLNDFLPYSRRCNPIYLSIAFKILHAWKFHENQWFDRGKKKQSNGLNEKSCIKSPTFIPSVSLLLLSQVFCAPRLLSPKPADDEHRDRGLEGRLLGNGETLRGRNYRLSTTFGGSKQDSGFSGNSQGSQPCTGDLFTFCFLFFCQTIIDKEKKKSKQPTFRTKIFLSFYHQSSKNSSLLEKKMT